MAKSATIFVNSPDDDLNTDDIEAEVVDFDQADEDLTDDDEELADGFDGEPVDFEADDEDDGDRGTRGAKRSPTIGANDDAEENDDDDDTEKDLAAELNARLGMNDDAEEDDDDQPVKASISSAHTVVEEGDGFSVRPRQASEWTCAVCFLIVNKAAAAACPHCGADASQSRRELASS